MDRVNSAEISPFVVGGVAPPKLAGPKPALTLEDLPETKGNTDGSLRVDIWLWAVRQFKTRSAATNACKAGHVRVNGKNAKASTPVRRGDLVVVKIAGFDRHLQVVGLLPKRVGASIAQSCYLDLSPQRLPKLALPMLPQRQRGAGRPTKKERRELDRLRGRPSDFHQ